MDGDPFLVNIRLNGTDFSSALIDNGCLCYGTISDQLFHSLRLPRIEIPPRELEGISSTQNGGRIDSVTFAEIDIDGHQQKRVFFYVIPGQSYDVVLGKRWMEDMDVHISSRKGCLDIRHSDTRVWNRAKTGSVRLTVSQVMASVFVAETKRSRKDSSTVFAISMADIEKALRPKLKTDPRKVLPPQYHRWLEVFSKEQADRLPPHRPGVDHEIRLEKDSSGRDEPVPWGPLYGMSREELLVLRKTITELLDKNFI